MNNDHCRETEPCVDDVYCNCECEKCVLTDCWRPGCNCGRSHVERDKFDEEVRKIWGVEPVKVRK